MAGDQVCPRPASAELKVPPAETRAAMRSCQARSCACSHLACRHLPASPSTVDFICVWQKMVDPRCCRSSRSPRTARISRSPRRRAWRALTRSNSWIARGQATATTASSFRACESAGLLGNSSEFISHTWSTRVWRRMGHVTAHGRCIARGAHVGLWELRLSTRYPPVPTCSRQGLSGLLISRARSKSMRTLERTRSTMRPTDRLQLAEGGSGLTLLTRP